MEVSIYTRVNRTKKFEKDLDRVQEKIRIKVILWIGLVEMLGLREVRKRPGYHDEPLKGKRHGQRSVRMNQAYRLIYNEQQGAIEILLLEVNKHEY
jgi:proteic killer suppression protein